jgi:methionine aminopeptidase
VPSEVAVRTVGPTSEPGHVSPRDDLHVEPGHLVHIDVGVRCDGFCSDLQRMWYVRKLGETAPPSNVQRAFATVVRAIEAGAEVLRPGIRGHEVDARARQVIVDAGAKALSRDTLRAAPGLGLLPTMPGILRTVNDYHGFVDPLGAGRGRLGEILPIAPNHVCPVVDHYAETVVVRAGQVVDVWPVDARGRSR